MDAMISIYTTQQSPRFRWASKVFFERAMGVPFQVFTELEAFELSEGFKVNYSPTPIEHTFQILPHKLIWEQDIVEQEFYVSNWEGIPTLCQRQIGDLPFDPLAATFFLVARYEEYLPFIADEHGRFPAVESFAYLNGFLDRPVVNEWAVALGRKWFGKEFTLEDRYQYLTTVDIDNLFAFKGKGALRTIGALAKDVGAFNFKMLRMRLGALWNLRRDPYDTFRKQRNWNKSVGVDALYFMLFADFGPKDRNVSPYSTDAAITLREIADWAQMGIHPSYASDSKLEIVGRERGMLQEVVRRPITQSRQHYLRMRTPHTFRNLIELGIKDEYSMGYTEQPGFRANMACSYPFYDLELEQELPLNIHTFVFMDVTYYDPKYMNLDSQASLEAMLQWVPKVKSVGGTLVSVWHNRTYSEFEPQWEGWAEVYKTFIHGAKS